MGTIMMSVNARPGLSRRSLINFAAAGLGAGLAAACSGPGAAADSSGGDNESSAPRGLADTVLEVFKTHRLVGLGEAHNLQEHHDALGMLFFRPEGARCGR